jgi:RNA polymerase sigma-54 factor
MFQQIQSHTHRHLTTAHLAQTMTLLALPANELRQTVEKELANNPALELVEATRCPACGRATNVPGLCRTCAPQTDAQAIIFTSPAADFYEKRGNNRLEIIENPENEQAEIPSLQIHLLRQIAPDLAREDRAIAAHLLTGLNDDGLLETDPAEIAIYFRVNQMRVEAVRRNIQQAEPFGCGSTSPREAIQIQLDILKESRKIPAYAVVCLENFEMLAHKQFAELAAKLGCKPGEIETAARFINANLNPYPARANWGIHSAPQLVYNTPDVAISQVDSRPDSALVIEILTPFEGYLRLNPLFKQSLTEASGETADLWRADLERADLLVKCLSQRNTAMELLMKHLASLQREFILRGEAYLAPLTRAETATALGMHESTISRAVSGKSVQLPNGRIIPMSRFFERNLNVRQALKSLVQQEGNPLSDDELAARLSRMGFPVARRTVTKYRSLEGIPAAHQRQTRQVGLPGKV